MEYTKEQLEKLLEEKSLALISAKQEINSLVEIYNEFSTNYTQVKYQAHQYLNNYQEVPKTYKIRISSLNSIMSVLKTKIAAKKKEYQDLFLEIENITEDLMKLSKKKSSKK